MPVRENTILTTDVAEALDLEFIANFRGEYTRFAEMIGLLTVETLPAGTALHQIKITGQLDNTASGDDGTSGTGYVEGDFIKRSHYEVEKVPWGEMTFAPYAKQTTAQAILKGGLEQAVLRTDAKMAQQIRAAILDEMFAALGNGIGTATGVGLQAALAMADAVLGDTMESNGDEPGRMLHFINRLDAAEYLGKAEITTQNAFGMTYLENFLGIEGVILTNKVTKGNLVVTPVDNIHVYGLDFATLGDAGLDYTTAAFDDEDETWGNTLDGLIGVHHAPAYDYASVNTFAVNGAKFLPEILNYIVKGTIAPSA